MLRTAKTWCAYEIKTHEFYLYTDYLISQFGATTAAGLSALLDGEISHDKVTRFLSERRYTRKDLWLRVKPVIRQVENEESCLIIDDTIQEKAWTDENDLICWYFDHCSGRTVKGINLLNALCHQREVSIPVDFQLIQKPCQFSDIKIVILFYGENYVYVPG
mgnify:FL=1